jgi:hypothetical protein
MVVKVNEIPTMPDMLAVIFEHETEQEPYTVVLPKQIAEAVMLRTNTMESFKYGLMDDGLLIATFGDEHDRDYIHDLLEDIRLRKLTTRDI